MNKTPSLFPPELDPKCKHVHVELTLTPRTVHYGREDCLDCGSFVRWIKTPPDAMKHHQKPKPDWA